MLRFIPHQLIKKIRISYTTNRRNCLNANKLIGQSRLLCLSTQHFSKSSCSGIYTGCRSFRTYAVLTLQCVANRHRALKQNTVTRLSTGHIPAFQILRNSFTDKYLAVSTLSPHALNSLITLS